MGGEGAHSLVRDRTGGISGKGEARQGVLQIREGGVGGEQHFKDVDVTGVKGLGQEGLGRQAGPIG